MHNAGFDIFSQLCDKSIRDIILLMVIYFAQVSTGVWFNPVFPLTIRMKPCNSFQAPH